MRRQLMVAAVIAAVVCCVGVASATEIHVVADLAGTQTTMNVFPVTPFLFHIVADEFPADDTTVRGHEFSVDTSQLTVAGGLVITRVLPAGSLNVGSGDNFIVGVNPAFPTAPEPVLLATYQAVVFGSIHDVLISVGASTPSSFGGLTGGYVDQDLNLTPFTYASPLLLNPFQLPAPPLHDPGEEEPPIPEPGSCALMLLGCAGLIRKRRR